ncbi:CheR: chemotaxis protein methyltransferase [Desulfosarcina variabilis str. Montpellier]|jgi:chemotaxis protein methyltransferase CheR|uniref:CheR family methyltransferase n=1 Tax=Desulfosarcina variabilis TaxID=2300 RepID=UPI003AFB73EE
MIKIKPDEIKVLSNYIYSISGISIDASKAYLLETRFGKLLEEEGCKSYNEFYHKAKSGTDKVLETKIINAITTNETLFFRDNGPFDLLKFKILPDLIDIRGGNGKRPGFSNLKIWSSACSTGQEIYSVAIVIKELLGNSNQKFTLLGTDLSNAAVTQASAGIYNKFEIERGLPREKLQRYFVPAGGNWKIKDEIRAMASFRRMNLMQPFVGLGKFDIILCRNVAIYFTLSDRKKLFNKIADILEPDGYLIIGSTESLTGVCPRFIPKRHLRSIYYQLD